VADATGWGCVGLLCLWASGWVRMGQHLAELSFKPEAMDANKHSWENLKEPRTKN
jgi:hypothetical protein